MGVIARSLLFAAALTAGAQTIPREVLADLATDLSTENPNGFLSRLTPTFPDREKLREDLGALCARYDVSSSIDILEEAETAIEVDWFIELRERTETSGTILRRRERVRLEFEKTKRGWKVSRMAPVTLFSPEG